MRRSRRRRRIPDWAIGITVIALVLVFLHSAFTRSLPPPLDSLFGPREHTYRIAFADAGGVVPRVSPVRIAGVNVGKVTGVESGPGDATTVVVEVSDDALPLHTDATAQVRPRTFLEGNFFVDLHPGSPSAPVLGDGGAIPVNQTYGSVQFDQILDTFTHPVRGDLKTTIRALGDADTPTVQRSLRGAAPKLAPLFLDVARVSEATRGLRRGDLAQAIDSTSRVADRLASSRLQLGHLVSSFATVAAALADNDARLRASLGRLPALLSGTRTTFAALNDAFPQVRALVREVRPALRAAPPVLRSALPLTAQASALLSPSELPRLVDRLRPATVDLAASAPGLQEALRLLQPTSSCLLSTVVPTLLAKVPDAVLSTGDPAYLDLAHLFVGLASAAQNFDGNGYALRYYTGFSDELLTSSLGAPSDLIGLGEDAPIGSRPSVPNRPPPLRPGVPCTAAGGPVDLSANTGPGDFERSGARLHLRLPSGLPSRDSAALERRLARALEGTGR